ncbi:MAG: hypothetical protein AAB511_02765 [Patescibacteria group bacterium]
MNITEELQQQIEAAAARIHAQGTDQGTVGNTGMVLVVKDSPAHQGRIGKVQYLSDFKNGGDFVLFAS